METKGFLVEDSKREHKIIHQTKMNEPLDGLIRQIEEQKHIPSEGPTRRQDLHAQPRRQGATHQHAPDRTRPRRVLGYPGQGPHDQETL